MDTLTIIEFRVWVDNCIRDFLTRGWVGEDAAIVLLDKARELIVNGIMDREKVK